MDTAELRRLADDLEVSSKEIPQHCCHGKAPVNALRLAADEIDKLRVELAAYRGVAHPAKMLASKANVITSRHRHLHISDPVVDLLYMRQLAVEDALAALPRTDRICHHTKAPCESPDACDAQQACARGKA